MTREKGTRVMVWDASGKKCLGKGTYEGEVPIYWVKMPDGATGRAFDDETKPDPEDVPEGAKVVCAGENPKIRLDDGQIVYGCETWWKPLSECSIMESDATQN